MAKDYKALAKDILDHVGGESNVTGVRHCITRLRFNLKDESKADTEYLKKRQGVVTVVQASGQYQVVIGNEVGAVYEALMSVSNLSGASQDHAEVEDDRSTMDKFIDTLSGLFQPFLGILSAAGIIKGIGAILSSGFGIDRTSTFMMLWNMLGDGFFKFIPVALIITASQKFRLNTFTALGVGSVLLYPTLANLNAGDVLYTLFAGTPFASEIHASFVGIPVILPPGGSYYGTVIPMILAIWFASKVEKWVKSWMPQIVTSFFTPMLTILISGLVGVLVLGPLATWSADLIGAAFQWLFSVAPVVFHMVLQAAWQLLVIFGLHWGIIPLFINDFATKGFSEINAAVMGSTFPVFGAILAIWWKSREEKTRQIAAGAALPAFFGVTEPAIYGLMLPMRKVFAGAIAANALVGIYNGLVRLTAYNQGGLGVFAIPNYIDPSGAHPMNVWHRVISFALLTVLGFVFTLIIGVPKIHEDEVVTAEEVIAEEDPVEVAELIESAKEDIVASPLNGTVVPLSELNDPVFASGALGKGIGINPTEGVVYAPANATVVTMFPTGHAIGLRTQSGAEILIHVGIDTVELNGEGYEALVHDGDEVTAGQPLVRFDMAAIQAAGYSIQTPVVVTNTDQFEDVLFTDAQQVAQGDYLFTVVSKPRH